MNSAAIYKKAARRKRTYWMILVGLGVCAVSAIVGTGVYVGVEIEHEREEQEQLTHVPYEMVFRCEAEKIGWPWELLAALAWTESHYNPNAQSHVGARGVMQLMPQTGRRFGLNDSTFCLPEDNIRAGVEYIACLQRQFRFITDSAQQWRFVVASYNAGPAHIHDARRLAKRYGSNPFSWSEVEPWLEKLSEEPYYTDSVVLYGRFNSCETQKHVRTVEKTYNRICNEESSIDPR